MVGFDILLFNVGFLTRLMQTVLLGSLVRDIYQREQGNSIYETGSGVRRRVRKQHRRWYLRHVSRKATS